MKSTGWPKLLALAIAVAGLVAFGVGCTKSSESNKGGDKHAPKTGNSQVAHDDNGATAPKHTDDVAKTPENPPTDSKDGTAVAENPPDDTKVTPDGDPKDTTKGTGETNAIKKSPFTSKTVSSDASYTLQIKYPNEVANGATGTVTVTVIPAEGWKMNKDYPTKLTVEAPAGVSITKNSQKVPDAVEFDNHKAVFAVEFTPSSAGTKAFSAKFKFAVCTDATCDPKKTEMAWNTSVM